MITIESKEDIEVLLDFFNLLNTNSTESFDSGKLNQRIERIEELLEEVISEIRTTTPEVDNSEQISTVKTIRTYPEKTFTELPKIKSLREDGYFLLGKNRRSKWNIKDLLKLRALIPHINLNYHELGSKIGVSEFTGAQER